MDKTKRYCKGCQDEVTETMFCWCGENHLSKSDTYTEDELDQMDAPEFYFVINKDGSYSFTSDHYDLFIKRRYKQETSCDNLHDYKLTEFDELILRPISGYMRVTATVPELQEMGIDEDITGQTVKVIKKYDDGYWVIETEDGKSSYDIESWYLEKLN